MSHQDDAPAEQGTPLWFAHHGAPQEEIARVEHGRILYDRDALSERTLERVVEAELLTQLDARTRPRFGEAEETAEAYLERWLVLRRRARRQRELMEAAARRVSASPPVRVDPPGLALRLFSRADAEHYAREWGAHLWELVADGEHRQARRDRRRMALGAPWLALQLRTRALLRRRLRSPR